MLATDVKSASIEQAPSIHSSEPAPSWLEFVSALARKHAITGDLLTKFDAAELAPEKQLQAVWKLTDLPAGDFADEVARFFKLPRMSLPQLLAASSLADRFSPRFLREMLWFPCQLGESTIATIVVADPTDANLGHVAELMFGGAVEIAVASFEDIETVLSKQLGWQTASDVGPGEPNVGYRDEDVESLRDLASGAPVVRAVNDLLEKAVELRATDLHIEPYRGGLALRMRIDGLLRPIPTPADVLPQALISRIKILAGLNIAERRLPQDGAAHLRVSRSNIDVRVATMPAQHGETAVIRLLPKDRGILEISRLGLSDADQQKLQQLLELPHGMIVVTGPTGSGKTTTLATMLTALNETTRKILTIEDPIEYEIRGVNQSQVKPEIGLTFATALRAFVRQDPDVIMVGEIRDAETAHIAIHAALTGHLVLTTLHTETAAAAVPRLLDLGVEGTLLQSTLRAVIAQRLTRVLCERCKVERFIESAVPSDPRYAVLGLSLGDRVCEPVGCERCNGTGYRGRTGIFEVMEINDETRGLVGSRADSRTIAQAAARGGMTTMFEHGVEKCCAGVTSAAEILRVTTAQ